MEDRYLIAGKFDGQLNLAVGVETANITSNVTCSAVVLLAPPATPLCELDM